MREMKDSGVEWIGLIPQKWSIFKIKNIGKYINGYAFKPDDWSSSGIPIIRIQDLTGSNDNPNYYNGEIDKKYKVVRGDILVSWAASLNAFIWNKENGWLNQHIFKAIPNERLIVKEYFIWILKLAMENMNNDNKHGIVMQHVTLDVFNNFKVTIPNIDEQKRISEILNKKITEIDNVIKKTKETIEDYKKYKQAIITKAITKGINKDIRFKDSGIDWMGYVPENWIIKKIRYLGSLQNGISAGAEKFGSGYPFANYGDIYNNIALPEILSGLINSTENDRKTFSIKKNDIFFTRTSETIGEVGFSAAALADIKDACFSGFIIRFRPYENNMQAEFYKYYFRSDIHRKYFVKEMNIVTRASLGQDLLKNMPVLIPSKEEQLKIANYLDRNCLEIDKLISINRKNIEELEQYKKSLIYEYVTGKKEVV